MVSPNATPEDLRALGREWGANLVRWQLMWDGFPHGPADTADFPAYQHWLDRALAHFDTVLPVCATNGLRVVLDLHSTPGGRNQAWDSRLFDDRAHQEQLVEVWRQLARRYQGNTTIWAYDLVNEPSGQPHEGVPDWPALALRVARVIREIEPDRRLVIEPSPWASPSALTTFAPLPLDNIVYSVHMYEPQAFTHQGVFGKPSGVHYPGTIDGRRWDQAEIQRTLQPVIEFQRRHGVPIYIGEFSAIRWAPGTSAHDYLRDCLAVFEEHGWHWSYHAFREWDGWSVEHTGDPTDHRPSTTPTDRARLLRDAFQRNRPAP